MMMQANKNPKKEWPICNHKEEEISPHKKFLSLKINSHKLMKNEFQVEWIKSALPLL